MRERYKYYLLIWLYSNSIMIFLTSFVPVMPYIKLFIYLFIGLDILICTKRVYIRILYFYVVCSIIILMNAMTVSYKEAVFSEGIIFLMTMIIPTLIISMKEFKLEEFFDFLLDKLWILNVFLIVLCLFRDYESLNYSVFNYVCTFNILIACYGTFYKDKIKLVSIIFNFVIACLFASRREIVIVIIAIAMMYILFARSGVKKKALILLGASLCLIIWHNIVDILLYVQKILIKYNINSRNISLILNQLENPLEGIYLSGREKIYSIAQSFIDQQHGFPGGFGVILGITNKEYYHAHSLILSFEIFFGKIGSILVLSIISIRFFFGKIPQFYKKFIVIFIILFVINAWYDEYFLDSVYFMIAITLLFLKKYTICD